LQVGQTQQSVTVEASAQGLSTEDASLGAVINNNTVSDTPLYLRNWDDLLLLCPACNPTGTRTRAAPRARGARALSTCTESIRCKNDFILDGIDNNTFSENVQELSTQAGHPSVETIQGIQGHYEPLLRRVWAQSGRPFPSQQKAQQPISWNGVRIRAEPIVRRERFFSRQTTNDNRKTIKTSSAGAWAPDYS